MPVVLDVEVRDTLVKQMGLAFTRANTALKETQAEFQRHARYASTEIKKLQEEM